MLMHAECSGCDAVENFPRYLLAPLASPLQAALAYVVVLRRVILA